jgi:hypothetical protein
MSNLRKIFPISGWQEILFSKTYTSRIFQCGRSMPRTRAAIDAETRGEMKPALSGRKNYFSLERLGSGGLYPT